MRITLSERQFCEQIRQLENLGPEITIEEMAHRIDKYARRLFEHIANYGVQMLGDGFQLHGKLATMTAALKQSWNEEDVQTRMSGLALMAPVSVTLDASDLDAFVVNPVMLAAMQENWSAFSHSLDRLTLTEVRPAIEQAAKQLMSAPMAAPTNQFEAMQREDEYQLFLARAGKKDPLAKWQQADEYRQAEENAVKARRTAALNAFINGE